MAADNTTLPAGAGGDTVRTANRAGVKTQIIMLDFGPDAGPENLVSASNGLPVAQQGTWNLGITGSVAVTGTFWQATQPVSIAAAAPVKPDGAVWTLTGTAANVNVTNASLAVTGTFWQATQPVSVAAAVPTKPDGTVWMLTGTSANVNVTNASLAVTGTFWQATQPVSGTVTANQGTANTLANAWTTELTDGTTGPVAVKAASTAAVATDKALVVAVSPNNTIAATQSGAWTVTTTPPANASTNLTQIAGTALGVPTNFGTGPGAVVAASANASLFIGTTVATASAAGVQKVGISGNAAATLDAVITAATAPANGVATLAVNNTTAPSLTTGQSVAAQCTWDGSLFVQNVRRSNVKAAAGTIASTTAATLLAAQAAGIFADLAGLVLTVAAIATTADAIITVNISDGTTTYKFGINTGAITTVGNVDTDKVVVNFSPPIPATSAATAWTIALSTANTTVAFVATFILQKAS